MLVTERLMLRPWWDDDFERLAAIHADPDVMKSLGGTRSRVQSDVALARMMAQAMNDGFGPWAVEAPRIAPLIGLVGLRRVAGGLPCAPCVEIIWRIGKPWWNQGYATEAARAAIADGFTTHGLTEIVAFTAASNTASRRVMEHLNMTHHRADDFNHPNVPPDSPLHRHVLYRLARRSGGPSSA